MMQKDLCSRCEMLQYVTCPKLDKAQTEGYVGLTSCEWFEQINKLLRLYLINKRGDRGKKKAEKLGAIRPTPEIY